MNPLTQIEGRAIPLGRDNIDTDIIIPARWLKTTSRTGLGRGAFESLRAEADNIFDSPAYVGAPILIAGENFGCGSSREHAAWALLDLGVRVVIAPSFSDIFAGNAVKNGILPLSLSPQAVARLLAVAPSEAIAVDLVEQKVTTRLGDVFAFEIDDFRKECLLNGLDEIDITTQSNVAISAFEHKMTQQQPWLQSVAT